MIIRTSRTLITSAAVLAALALLMIGVMQRRPAHADVAVQVDTALIVSVDVSNSVDAERYRLQMEGIAKALEDPSVIDAIVSGPNAGILFSMVTWADKPSVALPWTRITGRADAMAVARRVRELPHQGGEFTCMTRMMRSVNDKIVPQIPARALRVVIDVSGDGPDNCNAEEPIDRVRDELVAGGVTINGLPILIGGTTAPKGGSLEDWYRSHVMGGAGSFVLPADGYSDFGRAIRQKFVIEVSGVAPGGAGRARQASLTAGSVQIERAVEPDRRALEVDQLR